MTKLRFNRLFIVFSVCFLLIGCIPPRIIITPNDLPTGVIGKNYYAQITIDGGSGPISGSGFQREIYPINSGLEIISPEINGRVEYNNLAVKGIPKIIGDIKVIIQGGMISSGWNAPSDFKKVYIIKVTEQEK
ncbi:hypothetical protein [uncultured Gilliamella sp.]|uniref:hypothetical protein n=1 Tax=uncultured Gilliamella sp. TaxID=1193505 RepID=UPI0025ED6B2C|nr:hypothetical protein [uncultured Gilliamella sp.]